MTARIANAEDHETENQEFSCDTPPPQRNLDQRRARWAHLLRNHHYEPVIYEILSNELPKYTSSRVIQPTDLVSHMRECALILASAPKVFFAAVEGNLVSCIAHDADLQAENTAIQQRAYHQPSVYVHLLADHEGKAPTPTQYLIIHDVVLDYISNWDSEHAYCIDNTTPPLISLQKSAQGHRKYLSTARTPRSPVRIAILHRLCAGISTRCSQTPPHLQHTPLPYPPAEVGYALNAHKRLAQHRTHHSSNYVMNLVEDICTHLYHIKALPQHFTMHQFIVYLIFRPRQAAIAEIFVSGLLQCWVDEGGFNAYPAGRSVASAGRVREDEWRGFGEWARELGLGERMEELRRRAEVWRRALEWETEEGEMEDEGGESKDNARLEGSME